MLGSFVQDRFGVQTCKLKYNLYNKFQFNNICDWTNVVTNNYFMCRLYILYSILVLCVSCI